MNKVILPGLALYCVSSSLGLFLGRNQFGTLMMAWLTGLVFLSFALAYSSFTSQKPLKVFPYITLGAMLLNFLIQVTGGIHSLIWPAYFLFTVLIAGFSRKPLGRTYGAVGLIIAIETANLLAPKQVREFRWEVYAGYMLSLAGVALTTAHIMHRIRKKEQQVRLAHEQLLAHAEAVNPLSDKSKLPSLTREGRQAANVDAALTREVTFNSLLDFIYELVPAHTYALFLKERRSGKKALALRAIRSESAAAAGIGATPDLDPEHGQWIIGSCAKNNAPRHFDNGQIRSGALGYYVMEVPIRSFLAIPIRDENGAVLGVLAVDSLESGAFSEETREVLERFTPFFIQIIDRIRIAQELDVRASYFESLHRISAILNSSLDIMAILYRLTKQLVGMVPHDLCLFLKYDQAERKAVVLHKSGRALQRESIMQDLVTRFRSLIGSDENGDSSKLLSFPIEENGIFSQMLRQWEGNRTVPYHFPDLSDRRAEIKLLGDRDRSRPELGTLSCWPLVSGSKFIGAFFLGSVQVDAFSELQRNFLDTLMNQLSLVMDNVMMHQQISDMAQKDGLTGLLNHRAFMEKLDHEFSRLDRNEHQHFSLMLFDIDFFKKVNDEHGHPVGDVALKRVSDVIRQMARNIDFAARYGGEEFAVGMVGADSEGAKAMAERIRKAVENTVITAGKITLRKTVSIGVASYTRSGMRKEELISQADQALYHAKHTGRNKVCLYKEIPIRSSGQPINLQAQR